MASNRQTVPGSAPERTASTMTTASQPFHDSISAAPSPLCSRTAKEVCPCLRNWRATNRPAASSPRHSFPIPITRVGLLCRSASIKYASVTNNPCCNVSLAIYFQLQKVGGARDARVVVAHGLFTAGTKLLLRKVEILSDQLP